MIDQDKPAKVADTPALELEAAQARTDLRLEAVRLALQAADQSCGVVDSDCGSVLEYARRITAFVEGRA